jgi:hypothetical protein
VAGAPAVDNVAPDAAAPARSKFFCNAIKRGGNIARAWLICAGMDDVAAFFLLRDRA